MKMLIYLNSVFNQQKCNLFIWYFLNVNVTFTKLKWDENINNTYTRSCQNCTWQRLTMDLGINRTEMKVNICFNQCYKWSYSILLWDTSLVNAALIQYALHFICNVIIYNIFQLFPKPGPSWCLNEWRYIGIWSGLWKSTSEWHI